MQNTVAKKLKQVPEGYLVVGVDPHKKRHAAVVITQDFTAQAKFMVNKEPHYKSISNYYECPSCHTFYGVEPDDSFLKAMVSEEQMTNIVLVENALKENKALEPLKAFLNLPCEICGQLMTEWSEQDLRRGVMGGGWGHTRCWNTTKGQARQFAKLVKEEMERRMRSPSK